MADWHVENMMCPWDGMSEEPPSGEGPCPLCGAKTTPKEGKFGKFYGCSKFPKCKGSRDYE